MTYAENKDSRRDFDIVEEYSAGISLEGFEVKGVKSGRANLRGSKVVVRGGEAFLVGASIRAFQEKNAPKAFDPERARKLLLSKRELRLLAQDDAKGGLTFIPLSLYNRGGLIKLSFGIGKKRKTRDKRELLKKRDADREAGRALRAK